jgi:two-component system LytT family response regulator
VEEDRLADALDRARTRLAEKRGLEEAEKLKNVLAEVAPDAMPDMEEEGTGDRPLRKLINIKDRGQIFRVDVDTIERIEAAGDYMCIYTGDNSLILRETMKDLERRLDPRVPARPPLKIVNLDQVRQVRPYQRRMLPRAGIGRGSEGQPVLSRRGGPLRPLIQGRDRSGAAVHRPAPL